jgi:hypothetical protein
LTEHQRAVIESDDDLIRLAPSGFVHLRLIRDRSYLAACVEETWVEDQDLARRVAERVSHFGPKVHLSEATMNANSDDFMQYLVKMDKWRLSPDFYLEGGFSGISIASLVNSTRSSPTIERTRMEKGWEDFEARFSVGLEYAGVVDGTQEYGVFVRLDGGPTGLLHVKNIPSGRTVMSFVKGQRIVVKILDIQRETKKISLGLSSDT